MLQSKDYPIDTTHPVLVTGATGYIAGVLIHDLLQAGLKVHATVRDPSNLKKIQYLQDVADRSPGCIKFYQADLLEEGSFAEAMQDCTVVFHTASPCTLAVDVDPFPDLIDPAVKGTCNVLHEVSRTPSVTRVVLTSSCAAVYDSAMDTYRAPGNVLNEDVWNRISSPERNPYYYAKTMAELKAWEIAGSQTQWKLVVINPGAVLGPGLKYHRGAESFVVTEKLASGILAFGAIAAAFPVVDVREVAAAHMAAGFLPQASGRYILVGHNSDVAAVSFILARNFPQYPFPRWRLPLPKALVWALGPYIDQDVTRHFVTGNVDVKVNFDSSKSVRELGVRYRPLENTVIDMFQQMVDGGGVKVNPFYFF